jgi:hypothetical protein
MGERKGVYWVLVGKPEGKSHLGDPSIDGRVILKWVFRKWEVGYGLDRGGSGYRQVAGTCECGNEFRVP